MRYDKSDHGFFSQIFVVKAPPYIKHDREIILNVFVNTNPCYLKSFGLIHKTFLFLNYD